jgi:hypothetical protein
MSLIPSTNRIGLQLSWVDDDTIQVAPGSCNFLGGGRYDITSAVNVTFASIDTGTRTLGRDYYVFATAAGIKLTLIPISFPATLDAPSGYTNQTSRLLGYFHNGPDYVGGDATGAIFQYSVTSNDLINYQYPYRAMPDLPAGIPLPGMVKAGSIAVGIYLASHDDATASAAGSSSYPASRYGVVPWASITGWNALQVAGQSGMRLPTWAEWLMAVECYPGSATAAVMNGNTDSGSSTDGAGYLAAPGALTSGLAGLGAGLLSNGLYKYLVTLVNANGETIAGTANAGTTVANYTVDGQIALSAIPVGGAGTTARKIYRTLAGGSAYKLLYTMADNSTVVYTDNIADATIAGNAAPPLWNTTGSQKGTADPTTGGRTLTGTGPRVAGWTTAATRSWYSPLGIADPVGNVCEWVAQFFGGPKEANPGSGVAWGDEGDYAYNFQGQAYNQNTGGWTEGLPAMLVVGGLWNTGLPAGVRGADASASPGYSYDAIGFRPCR